MQCDQLCYCFVPEIVDNIVLTGRVLNMYTLIELIFIFFVVKN